MVYSKNSFMPGPGSALVTGKLAGLQQRMDQVAKSWTVGNFDALLKFYVNILPRILGAERCTIYTVEIGSDTICSIYGTGLEGKKIQPPREGSIAGRVISTGKGIIENNLDKREGFHTQVAEQTGFVTKNMVCAPIRSATNREITGAIQVLNKRIGSFRATDLVLLEESAAHLSASIESIIINQEISRISSQLNQEVARFDKEQAQASFLIAESPAMREALNLVRMVSNSPVNVLIQGENGVGKELIARLIHAGGERRDKPFVAVNCAAIPENLMESEFFGYEKGAFTGADRSRKGRFEEASGGTLLLDEIADIPFSMQPKFLRAIEEGEGSRLGSNKISRYDLRIISASNKDLKQELEQGRFREDLFFRLFSVKLHVPPLRERKEDITPLALAFLDETCQRFHKKLNGFSPEVLNLFQVFSWPGNVRQLRSEIERLVALTPADQYILADKCSSELQEQGPRLAGWPAGLSIPDQVQALEVSLIKRAMTKTGGNRRQAAGLLHITRQGLHKKMKRYGLA